MKSTIKKKIYYVLTIFGLFWICNTILNFLTVSEQETVIVYSIPLLADIIYLIEIGLIIELIYWFRVGVVYLITPDKDRVEE